MYIISDINKKWFICQNVINQGRWYSSSTIIGNKPFRW